MKTYLPAKPLSILISLTLFLTLTASSSSRKKDKTIQVNLDKICNSRSVSTLNKGRITTWNKGIDGGGAADGYLTTAASLFKGDKDPKALPDNPLFAATAQHPEVLLHYSNTDSVSNQTVAFSGTEPVGFDVPAARYARMFLAFTSAEGSSQITVELKYADGVESKSFEVPDYYADIQPNDPDFCYLAHDLAKWGKKNNMTEKDHHNIDLLDIHPDQKRVLNHIQIQKTAKAYLVLWSATGVRAGSR